jgi:small multidrug resistance pump
VEAALSDAAGQFDRPAVDAFARYRPWFYAAAAYNLAWGAIMSLFPGAYFRAIRMEPPNHPALWQVLGMFVLVYAPGYFWAARHPERHRHLIAIGLLGKLLGPLGFVWSARRRQLPLAFGLTLLTNDLLWWPAFASFLREAARRHGGWGALLRGE